VASTRKRIPLDLANLPDVAQLARTSVLGKLLEASDFETIHKVLLLAVADAMNQAAEARTQGDDETEFSTVPLGLLAEALAFFIRRGPGALRDAMTGGAARPAALTPPGAGGLVS
jgi:hypothetical protein